MKSMEIDLRALLDQKLALAGIELSALELVGSPYSFVYECGLDKERRALSVGTITAVEFEQEVGVILLVSHKSLVSGAEISGIVRNGDKWLLMVRSSGTGVAQTCENLLGDLKIS